MAVADSCGLWSDGGRVCSVAGEFPSGVWRGGRVPTSSMSRHGAPRDILITLVRIIESRPDTHHTMCLSHCETISEL